MITKHAYTWLRTGIALIISKMATLYKISFVIGATNGAMFSLAGCCTPLIGLFSNVTTASFVWALLLAGRYLYAPLTLSSLAFYIPGYCAAIYMASSHKMLRCGIALISMLLFIVHPVGFHAAPYTLFWLVPILVSMGFFGTTLFAQALGATFTAHAVGSVIWLYTVPMTADAWLSMVPLVALERCTYAAGIVVMYYSVLALSRGIISVVQSLHSRALMTWQ